MDAIKNKDAMDRLVFKELLGESQALQGLAGEKSECADFVSDVFSSCYKLNPEITDETSTEKNLIETLHSCQEFRDLVESTKLDPIASALGTVQLAQGLVEELRKAKAEKREADLDKARRQVRVNAKKAQEKADEWGEMVALISGNEPGQIEKFPIKERLELSKKFLNNKKFAKIADLFGRFKNVVDAAVEHNPTHGFEELVDVTLGDDIGRLVPAEIAKFKSTPKLFARDFLERQLLCYELRGEEPKGKGPIIVCLDLSGSMGTTHGNHTREEWGKAVCFALAQLANKEHRPFAFIGFSDRVVQVKVWEKGELDVTDRLELMSINNGGGTDFDLPLQEAFKVRNSVNALQPADIVFITDGECSVDRPDLLKVEKAKSQVRLHVVGIGVNVDSLNFLSDTEVRVDDFDTLSPIKGIVNSTVLS